MFFRTPHNYDRNEASDIHGLNCQDKSLAQQHFKDECDINVLFGKYLETGTIPQVLDEGLAYQDFEGIFDYQTAMNAVVAAKASFEQLPARIKNRFDNDPNKLLHFLHDPDNRAEAEFLGLINKEKVSEQGTPSVPTQPAENPTGPSGTPSSEIKTQPASKP